MAGDIFPNDSQVSCVFPIIRLKKFYQYHRHPAYRFIQHSLVLLVNNSISSLPFLAPIIFASSNLVPETLWFASLRVCVYHHLSSPSPLGSRFPPLTVIVVVYYLLQNYEMKKLSLRRLPRGQSEERPYQTGLPRFRGSDHPIYLPLSSTHGGGVVFGLPTPQSTQ